MIVKTFGGRKCRVHKNTQRYIQNHFKHLTIDQEKSFGKMDQNFSFKTIEKIGIFKILFFLEFYIRATVQ